MSVILNLQLQDLSDFHLHKLFWIKVMKLKSVTTLFEKFLSICKIGSPFYELTIEINPKALVFVQCKIINKRNLEDHHPY
jgi:hypothetical protein